VGGVRWAGYWMTIEVRNSYEILAENRKGRNHMENEDVDVSVIKTVHKTRTPGVSACYTR